MKKDLTPWFEYFKNNKKALKELRKIKVAEAENIFNGDLIPLEGIYTAQVGYGYSKFNEVTIKGLAQAYVNYLKSLSPDLSNIKILIAHDGSCPEFALFQKYFGQVLMASYLQVFLFDEKEPTTKDFCFFTLKKAQEFDALIYFSHFSDLYSRKAVYFYNANSKRFTDEQIMQIKNHYEKLDIFKTKEISDDFIYLKTNLLLQEYSQEISKLLLRPNDVKTLKIGIIATPSVTNLITKILGYMDYPYTLIKKPLLETEDKLLIRSSVSELKNSYIIKFSEDGQKLGFYTHKVANYFTKININDIFMSYLEYFGLQLKLTNAQNPFKYIVLGNFTRDNLLKFDEKYFLKSMRVKQLLNSRELALINDPYMYFDEDGRFYSNLENMTDFNPLMFMIIILEMLNYQVSQKTTLKDEIYRINGLYGTEEVDSFSYPINRDHLKDFLNIIQSTPAIGDKYIINKIPMTKLRSIKTQYAYKFNFANQEWLGIKFNKIEDQLMFYHHVTQDFKSPKQIRKYFKRIISDFEKLDKYEQQEQLKLLMSEPNNSQNPQGEDTNNFEYNEQIDE